MRLYVTGSTGFVGQWIRRRAEAQEGVWAGVEMVADGPLDILDTPALAASLGRFAPDAVLHLAAQSNVPAAIADPEATARTNVMGTLSLLAAMEQSAPAARLLNVGSGDVYGLVPEPALPIHEATPLAPRNPYAASKVAAEMFVLERARRGRLAACSVRSFNHTGPGQGPAFVFPAIARQLARLQRAGRREGEIVVGDLDITRDFLDVRDVADAYLMLLQQGEPGQVYNVASGVEVNLGQAAAQLAALARVDARFVRDPKLLRPAEQRRVRADAAPLRALGWAPRFSFDITLRDLLQDYLSRPDLELQ